MANFGDLARETFNITPKDEEQALSTVGGMAGRTVGTSKETMDYLRELSPKGARLLELLPMKVQVLLSNPPGVEQNYMRETGKYGPHDIMRGITSTARGTREWLDWLTQRGLGHLIPPAYRQGIHPEAEYIVGFNPGVATPFTGFHEPAHLLHMPEDAARGMAVDNSSYIPRLTQNLTRRPGFSSLLESESSRLGRSIGHEAIHTAARLAGREPKAWDLYRTGMGLSP